MKNINVTIQITYLPSGKVESISITSPTGNTLTANRKYRAVYSDKFKQLWDRLVSSAPLTINVNFKIDYKFTFGAILHEDEMNLFRANVESTQNGIEYKKGYRIGY